MQPHYVPLAETFINWQQLPLIPDLGQLQGFRVDAAADESSPGSGASIMSPSQFLKSSSDSDSESSRALVNDKLSKKSKRPLDDSAHSHISSAVSAPPAKLTASASTPQATQSGCVLQEHKRKYSTISRRS